MKNLKKIIILFAFIFLAGIFITIRTVNSSLNKETKPNEETVEIQKDTLHILKNQKKRV